MLCFGKAPASACTGVLAGWKEFLPLFELRGDPGRVGELWVFFFWVLPASAGSAGLCPGCFSAASGRLVLLFWASPVPNEMQGGVNAMPPQAAKRVDFTSRGLALI